MARWEDRGVPRTETELMVPGRGGLDWRRATDAGAEAVEVAAVPPGFSGAGVPPGRHVWVAVRNAAAPDGPAVLFDPMEWRTFVGGIAAGEFAGLLAPAGGGESGVRPVEHGIVILEGPDGKVTGLLAPFVSARAASRYAAIKDYVDFLVVPALWLNPTKMGAL